MTYPRRMSEAHRAYYERAQLDREYPNRYDYEEVDVAPKAPKAEEPKQTAPKAPQAPTTTEGNGTMKTSMLVTLLTEGFALLGVKFERSEKTYYYKAPLAYGIVEGETVVVESPHSGYTCVKVVSVDNEPIIDVNGGYSYKWIVQRVDDTAYREHGEKEKLFYKHLNRLRNKALAENELARMRQAVAGTSAAKELDEALAAVTNPMGANSTGGPIPAGNYGRVGEQCDLTLDVVRQAAQATQDEVLATLVYKNKHIEVFVNRPYANTMAYVIDRSNKVTGFSSTASAVAHAMNAIDTCAK